MSSEKSGWLHRLTTPVRKLPRWCWLLIGALTVLVLLLHTQPLEKIVWRQVVSRLPAGVKLEVDRFDLNLFRLAVYLRGVRLNVDGAEVKLERITVNAGAGVLSGRIDLDEVLVADGTVVITPPTATEPSHKETGPADHTSNFTGSRFVPKRSLNLRG